MSKSKKYAIRFLVFSLYFFILCKVSHALDIKGHGIIELQYKNRHWQYTFASKITQQRAFFEILDNFGNSLFISSGAFNTKTLKKIGIKITEADLIALLVCEQSGNRSTCLPKGKKLNWQATLEDFRVIDQPDKNLAKKHNQDKYPTLPYRVLIKSKKAFLLFTWQHIERVY